MLRALAGELDGVRRLTEALAEPLSAEDQTAQSMPDVSPTKWHRAHTTWFFETFLLERFEPGFAPYEPTFRVLFNSYYETVGDQHPRARRGDITRPGITEVAAYRADVDRRVDALLRSPNPPEGIDALVRIGIQHEQQHQELLLMDIKHVLSCNPLEPAYRPSHSPSDVPGHMTAGAPAAPRWLAVSGGLVEIGACGDSFSFDNEHPRHRVHLEPFELADRLVTVTEWQEFIDDGGYARPELWLSDGWHTVCEQRWQAPLYWRSSTDGWRVHTLTGTRPLHPAEPVCHVSHYEADAFARWAGARLPTEAEWEHAITTVPTVAGRCFDLDELHPRPVLPIPRHQACLTQADGECWQWTASAYLPYPGFVPAPGAVGEYNGKFMSGQMVLRGSSALTPPAHARPTYRNFFPPAARWPMTGVRLARSHPDHTP